MSRVGPLRTLHLFAGAGGGLYADLILGHQPIAAVDADPFCCALLRERAHDGWFSGLRVHECDIREWDPAPYAGRVDCVSAGFPCQDISAAGRGVGIEGSRSGLWREVARASRAIRPRFVFLENSPRIRGIARTTIISEFVSQGYSFRDGLLAAADVGAGHVRDRWWCLFADPDGLLELEQKRQSYQWKRFGHVPETDANVACIGREERRTKLHPWQRDTITPGGASQAADALRDRLEVAIQRGWICQAEAATIEAAARRTGAWDWSPPDAGVCRVVDGLSSRVDRIRALGNAQVPLQAAAAWVMLAHRDAP